MTTCVLVLAVITCANVAPLTPQEAARVLTASVPVFVPPFVPSAQMPAYSYVAPRQEPVRPSRILPLSPQWSSVTTYLPRFGPPITVFDGQVSRTGRQRIPRFVR